MAIQLVTFVPLHCCNNNTALKMAAIEAETFSQENCEQNTSQTLKCILVVVYAMDRIDARKMEHIKIIYSVIIFYVVHSVCDNRNVNLPSLPIFKIFPANKRTF